MKTIGQKIRESRKKKGWKGQELGEAVGLTKSGISQIERDQRKGGIDPETLIKIADALDDLSILTHHCTACPIKKEVFLRLFPDLNNIRRDPAIIAGRLRKELEEAMAATSELAEQLSNADFKSRPGFMEEFKRQFEQVLDVKRCIETWEWELIVSGAIGTGDLKDIYENQQQKCIRHGHHKPEAKQEEEARA